MTGSDRRSLLRWLGGGALALAGCIAPTRDARPTGGSADEPASGPSAWPKFRYDRHNTGFPGRAADVEADPEAKWTFRTEKDIWGSPVVADGLVYIGGGDGRLYALDAATGEKRWAYQTDGRIEGTPSIAGGTVYVGSFDQHVYALDAATGEKRWAHETAGLIRSSPTVVDGTLYIGVGCQHLSCKWHTEGEPPSGGWVYALDAATGDRQWRTSTNQEALGCPAVADGSVYASSSDGNVYAMDAATGAVEWTFETGGWVWSSPAVADGLVYFGSWDSFVYAVDAETGAKAWWFPTEGEYVTASPTVAGDTVYIGAVPSSQPPESNIKNAMYGIDRRTGEERSAYHLNALEIGSSAVATETTVYFGTHAQTPDERTGVYALDREGGRRWFFPVVGRGVGTSPALVEGTLYFGAANGRVYAVE